MLTKCGMIYLTKRCTEQMLFDIILRTFCVLETIST